MIKLAIVTTHPIQYNAPWFALLAKEPGVELKVFYTWSQRQTDLFDDKFGKVIEWDIPLLEGYPYCFVPNTSKKPDNKHFRGIICPNLIPDIEQFGPTHILIFGWNFKAHYQAMKHFKGRIPVLFRGDSTLLNYDVQSVHHLKVKNLKTGLKSLLAYTIRRKVLTHVYRHVDLALYVGSHNKAYFMANGLKEHQLIHVPHAIDNDRFGSDPTGQYQSEADKIKQKLGWSNEDIVFLFAGKFEPVKNPFILMDAFLEVNKTYPSTRLLMVGNGHLEADLKQKAGNRLSVAFLPFQNQSMMPVVYRLGDVFCLPSKSETWGLAVNEAMACAKAVIVSDKVGCGPDLVVNGKNGYRFPHHNLTALVDCLKSMTEQLLNERALMGKHSQTIVSEYSFQRILSGLKQAFDPVR